jgi:hypothetical protein
MAMTTDPAASIKKEIGGAHGVLATAVSIISWNDERREAAMFAKRLSLAPVLRACFVILFAPYIASCAFIAGTPPNDCQAFESLPLTPLSAETIQNPVYGEPGTIITMHGSGSAQLNVGDYIKVEQTVDLPDYANRAAVFLNGWRLSYQGGDQNVLALGTLIGKIRIRLDPQTKRNKLMWDALGLLRDDDGVEGYNWTTREATRTSLR